MDPKTHLAVSAALGAAVVLGTGSWAGGIAAVAAGTLPDADHLVDFFNWHIRQRTHQVIYALHSWELLGLSLAATGWLSWSPLWMGITLGYGSHMVGDYLANGKLLRFYFVIYRARHRFCRSRILPAEVNRVFEDRYGLTPQQSQARSLSAALQRLLPRLIPFSGYFCRPSRSKTPRRTSA